MKFTYDPIGTIYFIALILLIAGVIPFTAVWVGLILILGEFELKFSWDL